jgi:beta-catenin-like protein 1
LKNLLPLAQAPVLAYPELVKSGMVALLIGLMSHENVDIVIDVVEVLHELTDEDVGNEAEEEGDQESNSAALKMLIEALVSHCVFVAERILLTVPIKLDNSMLDLLVSNLSRLNETEEADRQGVFHVLGKDSL